MCDLHGKKHHERNEGDQVVTVFHGQIPWAVSGINEKQNYQVPGKEECEKRSGAHCLFRTEQDTHLAGTGNKQQEQEQHPEQIQNAINRDGGNILRGDSVQCLKKSQEDGIEVQLPVLRFGQKEDIASGNDTAHFTGQGACQEGSQTENGQSEMISVVFPDLPVIQEIEPCIEEQRQDAAEHHIETAGQRCEEEKQEIGCEEQEVSYPHPSACRNGEQQDTKQGQHHFDRVLGTVEEHHVKVFQHTVGVRCQYEDPGRESMAAVWGMAKNAVDDAGKTADHDKIAKPEGEKDVMRECIEGYGQKQRAVQFHGRDVFPVRKEEGSVPAHFQSMHIQLCAVVIDHLRRFDKIHIGKEKNLTCCNQQKK